MAKLLRWTGSKGRMARRIISLFPPHHTYVEPFGGSAAVLLAKPPSPVEAYNDVDEGLVNFFRVLRDPEQFQKFHRLVSLTPYSRAEYLAARASWRKCHDPVEKAYRWFIVARMGFAARFESGWAHAITSPGPTIIAWLSVVKGLPEFASRLLRVQVECKDFRDVFKTYDTPQTLFYCDPPYVLDTRERKIYPHELTNEDHEELVDTLLHIQGMAVVSGYDHPIYKPLEEAGWRKYEYNVDCPLRAHRAGLRGTEAARPDRRRAEVLWVSHSPQGVPYRNHHSPEGPVTTRVDLWGNPR